LITFAGRIMSYTLTEIWIYPIKSLGGIRVKESEVWIKGLKHDRRWMLVDEKDGFLTQRTHPALALFKLSPTDQGFQIYHEGEEKQLRIQPATGDPIRSHVWDDEVEVIEADTLLSDWFSTHLGFRVRLVQFPESHARPVDARYAHANEQVSLADGYPLLLIGEASLVDLNKRLPSPVPMNRFRPNLVFSGGHAYEEDAWKEFRIGESLFKGVKPCSRCVLTTIDQDTGAQGKEPLATLASYRKKENKIYFGQNVLALNEKTIYEGATIHV
jgi:uncharacterized protein YcbX